MTLGLHWLRASIALVASCPLAPVGFLAPLCPLLAQDTSATRDTTPPLPLRYGHFHVGLTIHAWGVSLGNAPRVNGIRANVEDAELERVNGVNITAWKPREPLTGSVNGLALGIVGPGAADLNGAQVGLGGVVAERRVRWLSVGASGSCRRERSRASVWPVWASWPRAASAESRWAGSASWPNARCAGW